jgi:hypothetical protein
MSLLCILFLSLKMGVTEIEPVRWISPSRWARWWRSWGRIREIGDRLGEIRAMAKARDVQLLIATWLGKTAVCPCKGKRRARAVADSSKATAWHCHSRYCSSQKAHLPLHFSPNFAKQLDGGLKQTCTSMRDLQDFFKDHHPKLDDFEFWEENKFSFRF